MYLRWEVMLGYDVETTVGFLGLIIGLFVIAVIIFLIYNVSKQNKFEGSSAEDHSEGTFEKLYGKKEK